MRIKYDETEVGVVCYLSGSLEYLSLRPFREAIFQLAGKKQVIFELSGVPFVDSTGLGALAGTIRPIREWGGDAVVCSPRPSVNRVFEIVGLPRVVSILKSVEEARAYLLRPGVA